MSFSTIYGSDSHLQTDAVADKPRDVIKEQSSVNKQSNLSPTDENEKRTSNAINSQTSKVSSPSSKPKTKHVSTPTKKMGSKNSCQSQGAGGITVNISHSSGIQVGNTIIMNIGGNRDNDGTKKPQPARVTETKEIKRTKQSTEPVTSDDIQIISSHVGARWRELGRFLGYGDSQMDQFEQDNGRIGLKEVVFQLLLDWKRMNTKDATVGKICSALWSSEQYEAVEVLANKPTLS